jgi:amidase
MDGAAITCHPGPQPTNPHNPQFCAGGSSAGSAIVLLTGEADMAIGGDQGGSIRIPASWSGCYGLKPTWGLVPWTGAFPIEATIDHLGPMATTVEDCALLLEAIAGADGLDPRQRHDVTSSDYTAALKSDMVGMRVGILSEGFGHQGASERDVDSHVREAAERFRDVGAEVEDVSLAMHLDGPAIWSAIAHEGATYMMVRGDAVGTNWKGYFPTQLADAYGRARRARGMDFPDTVKLMAMVGHYMSDRYNHHYYAKAQNLSRRLSRHYDEALSQYDVLVLPTTPMKAMPIPAQGGDLAGYFATTLGMTANLTPFNVTGHPAMSVPCGTSAGLPVGMQIVGKHWGEKTVLRAAYAFQERLAH